MLVAPVVKDVLHRVTVAPEWHTFKEVSACALDSTIQRLGDTLHHARQVEQHPFGLRGLSKEGP